MSRPRRFLFLSLAAVAVVLAAGVWLVWPEPLATAITCENGGRIRRGMMLADAEEILGGPARDDSTRPLEYVHPAFWIDEEAGHVANNVSRLRKWTSDSVTVFVEVDDNDQVTMVQCYRMEPGPETLLEMFRRWLDRRGL